ncbi:7-methylguanosine phosphate-specific 5'-nucleotidase isoform X2 [Parasteatoda tepidariorum]
MECLNKPTVHIKNRDCVEELVSQLIKGGASKLQIISDFDHTISRVHVNNKRCDSTYGVLEHSHYISDEYKQQTNVLFHHYHPIEVDPALSKAQKLPYMIEWYSKNLDLMPISGVTKGCLKDMVTSSSICLRDGCDQVFETLYRNNIPLLVFSAGIGDILKEVLHQESLLYPNVKVIANFLQYDEKDKLLGFKGNMIHTFNKNLSSVENKDYFEQLSGRNNIILLGDSLGDLDMAEGAENVNVTLKIGYLNFNIEKSLPDYLDSYDIVLTDDQSMDVLVGLLQSIL